MAEFHADKGRKACLQQPIHPRHRLFATYQEAAAWTERMRDNNPCTEYHIIKREYGKYEVRP